jgi:hypothetical protein
VSVGGRISDREEAGQNQAVDIKNERNQRLNSERF